MCTYAHTPGWGMCGLRRILGVCAVGACALLGEIRGCMCGLEGAYTTVEIQSSGKSPEVVVNWTYWSKIASGGACGELISIYTLKTRF